MALKDLIGAAVAAVAAATANAGKGGNSGVPTVSQDIKGGGSGYSPLDSSGNDYAGMAGMSDLDRAALEAASSSWHSATTQEGKDAAHRQAESIRSKYGYSGGDDGSQYLSFGQSGAQKHEPFSYDSAPSYTNRYQGKIDDLTAQILGREDFSYDPEKDPTYQQYKESYTRSGERAMQDTLGQMSARTGGLASSYAGSASQQTYDNYMGALADKIPELKQLAYSMYRDEGNDQRANLDMLMALEQGDYAKYANLLGQYNTDRNFDYGVHRDQIADDRYNTEWDYGVGRDQIADGRYEDETAYNREQDAWEKSNYTSEKEYNQALQKAQTLASAGDFSGFKALGYTDEEIANLKSAYTKAQAVTSSGGGRGGSGGGGGKGNDETTGVLAAMYALGNDSAAYEYLLGLGLSNEKSTNLWSLYQNDGKIPSMDYGSILANAKAYYAEDPAMAESYVDRMLNSGHITQDEAADILEIELGIDIYEGAQTVPTTYEEFSAVTGNSGIMTLREFQRAKASGGGRADGYTNYQDYLAKMYEKYK